MPLTLSRITLAAAVAALAAAAPAPAQDEPVDTQEPTFEVDEPVFDEQYTHLTLPFRCDQAGTGQAACDVTLTATFRRTGGYPKFAPTGPTISAGSVRVSIAPGQKRDIELVTSKIIDEIAKTDGGSVMLTLTATVAGASFAPKIGGYGVFPEGCRRSDPYAVPWSGKGRLMVVPKKGAPKPVRTANVIPGTVYDVVGGPVTLSYNGVRATLAEGSHFNLGCLGQTEVDKGKLLLTPFLHEGRVAMSTSSSMDQPAAYVGTTEGNLGTRKREASRFTVTREGSVSVLRVQSGTSGGITPWNTKERSPCTAGSKLSVDRRGRIKRL